MITRQFTIYKIENEQNGKIYIGCTEKGERRIKQHFSELKRGKHISKSMQSDFDKGDTFRAVSVYAFSATVAGRHIDCNNSYYILYTAHALEKYYIQEYKADTQGYNGNYYVDLNKYPNDMTSKENAKKYLSQKIGKPALKKFYSLYPTNDSHENIYKPIDLYFSKANGIIQSA